MSRWWVASWVAVSALLGAGCSSTCSNLQDAANRCGQSFNQSACSKNIGNCTDADQRTLNDAADCTNNAAVCANGAIVSDGKFFSCVLPEASVSSACSKIFGN